MKMKNIDRTGTLKDIRSCLMSLGSFMIWYFTDISYNTLLKIAYMKRESRDA